MARGCRYAILPVLLWSGFEAGCGRKDRITYPAPPSGLADAGAERGTDGRESDVGSGRGPAPQPRAVLPGDRTAFGKTVEESLPAVRRFAQSSRHEAAVAAGAVIAALGHAIETLPDSQQLARAEVAEIRFESERLRRSDRMSFSIPKWIKLGLAAALDALDTLTPPSGTKTFWIKLAREANDAIDVGSGAAFQRAALQDALRSTVTAFVVVGQGLAACEGSLRH